METPQLYDEKYFQRLRQEYLTDTAWKKNRIANVLQLMEGVEFRDKATLDLACGIGTFAVTLSKHGAFAIGVDSSPHAMAASSSLFREMTGKKGVFLASDALSLPFKGNSLDIVVCADFIEHISGKEYERMLAECSRVLKPGGHLAIYTPNRRHFLEFMMRHNVILKRDESHIDIKTMKKTVGPLRTAGFQVTKQYFRPTHIKLLKNVESILIPFPFLGELFRRRICVLARKRPD
jgi:ubiquinone/menaquinone biosynthesis C-methylase UbiE